MNDKDLLEKNFAVDLEELLKEIKINVYTPKLFISMVKELGHYHATKKTIQKSNTSGYLKLAESERLDLCIENLVIKEEYKSLFTNEEIKLCKRRLGIDTKDIF